MNAKVITLRTGTNRLEFAKQVTAYKKMYRKLLQYHQLLNEGFDFLAPTHAMIEMELTKMERVMRSDVTERIRQSIDRVFQVGVDV